MPTGTPRAFDLHAITGDGRTIDVRVPALCRPEIDGEMRLDTERRHPADVLAPGPLELKSYAYTISLVARIPRTAATVPDCTPFDHIPVVAAKVGIDLSDGGRIVYEIPSDAKPTTLTAYLDVAAYHGRPDLITMMVRSRWEKSPELTRGKLYRITVKPSAIAR